MRNPPIGDEALAELGRTYTLRRQFPGVEFGDGAVQDPVKRNDRSAACATEVVDDVNLLEELAGWDRKQERLLQEHDRDLFALG